MSLLEERSAAIVELAIENWSKVEGGLMPLLHDVQKGLGFIPKDSVKVIARAIGLSRAEVHGVISFYHDFRYQPNGETTIQLCRAEACQAMGSAKLEDHVKSRLGIEFGGTTSNGKISLEPVYCLGNCACSPSIRIGDDVYARVDACRFDEILEEVLS